MKDLQIVWQRLVNAAGTTCPRCEGFADPAAVQGDRAQQLAAFSNAMFQIANRIRLSLSLPIDKIDPMSLHTQLRALNAPRS